MQKILSLIQKYRAGNRVLVETEYSRTVALRRKAAEEPICKIEMKDKNGALLCDILAVCGAAWLVCRAVRAIVKLFR